jgi:hypothetical protein
MTSDQLLENLEIAIPVIIDKIPRKWKNIQSLYIKTPESTSLPIYNRLPDLPIEISKDIKNDDYGDDIKSETKISGESKNESENEDEKDEDDEEEDEGEENETDDGNRMEDDEDDDSTNEDEEDVKDDVKDDENKIENDEDDDSTDEDEEDNTIEEKKSVKKRKTSKEAYNVIFNDAVPKSNKNSQVIYILIHNFLVRDLALIRFS